MKALLLSITFYAFLGAILYAAGEPTFIVLLFLKTALGGAITGLLINELIKD